LKGILGAVFVYNFKKYFYTVLKLNENKNIILYYFMEKKILKTKTKTKSKINSKQNFEALKKYLRVVNYISAAQLYLKDNFFLERELRHDDIKSRLLGH
jgi:hypothetical protein